MNIKVIENSFSSYSAKSCNLSDMTPFLLSYIRLILLFKDELSQAKLNVIFERQKQLRGDEFEGDGFDELMNFSRKEMDSHIANNVDLTREAMLNRMIFCALLDEEENDLFYLTEPMFEFVRIMKVSPDRLREILESEFVGFKA